MLSGGLLELDPLIDYVTIRGQRLEFRGLTVDDIIFLVQSFPSLIGIMQDAREDRVLLMRNMGARITAHVIACATGNRNDERALRVAVDLPASKQIEIFDKVFDLTFEDGASPFVERLMRMVENTSASKSSASPSEDSWSAQLVGDPLHPRHVPGRLVN